MTNHQDPKPNSIAERLKFNNHDGKLEESIAEYIAELSQLAEHCNYGSILQDMLQDRLVCGLKQKCIQQRLLNEGDSLTLEKAIDMESAIKQSSLI